MKAGYGDRSLRALQQGIAAAVMTPLTKSQGIARKNQSVREAVLLIKPNRRLKSVERLEIYSRSYWFRLFGSLSEDFPGLVAILGPSTFERTARAYLAACPSESFTLRDLGSRLEKWLRAHPGHSGRKRLLALDMVQLEWAHIVAFDGPKVQPLAPDRLTGVGPGTKLGLQPSMALLELHYPVDELRVLVNASQEGPAAASDAGLRKGKEPQWQQLVERMRQAKPAPHFVAVHRVDLNVYYRRLVPEEFLLLRAMRDGMPIGEAIGMAFADSSTDKARIPGLLELWFSTWAQLGWLCSDFKKEKRSL